MKSIKSTINLNWLSYGSLLLWAVFSLTFFNFVYNALSLMTLVIIVSVWGMARKVSTSVIMKTSGNSAQLLTTANWKAILFGAGELAIVLYVSDISKTFMLTFVRIVIGYAVMVYFKQRSIKEIDL